LAVTVLSSWSICDSGSPVDRFGLLEHAEHEVGDVAREMNRPRRRFWPNAAR